MYSLYCRISWARTYLRPLDGNQKPPPTPRIASLLRVIDRGPVRDAWTLSRGDRHERAAGVSPQCEEQVAREAMRYRNAAEPYYRRPSAAVRRIERGLSHKQSPGPVVLETGARGGRREADAVSDVARVGNVKIQNRQVS